MDKHSLELQRTNSFEEEGHPRPWIDTVHKRKKESGVLWVSFYKECNLSENKHLKLFNADPSLSLK